MGKVDQQFEHLSDAQIENYGDRTGAGPNQPDPSLDQAIERHLEACDACRTRLLAFHRSRFGLSSAETSPTPELPATPDCPSEDSLRNLAAGLTSTADSAALMQHIAQCDHCGPIFRACTEDFSDELSPADEALLNQLNSASPSWQQKVARQMSEAASPKSVTAAARPTFDSTKDAGVEQLTSNHIRGAQPPSAVPGSVQKIHHKSRFRLPRLKWLLVPAGAIACLLIAFFIWNAPRETPQKVEKLLAQAYTEQRTMEMRIPYAAHADFKQTRGDNTSLLNSPEALRKATDVIAANLEKTPDDPQWLLLSARLDLLDWRYRSSLSTLNKIDDEKVEDSPEFRLTQSLALYEKAEIEHDPQSYGKVINLLGKNLQKSPDDPVGLFNQGLACEKLYMYECAAGDYEHFLKIDPHSGWADEARDHLNRIKEKKNSRALALQHLADPNYGLAELQSEKADQFTSEFFLDIATTEWIDRSDDFSAPLHKLARRLRQQHQDRWLADFLAANSSRAAIASLVQAANANRLGELDKALSAATWAIRLSGQHPSDPVALRAGLEQIYSLRRQSKGAECARDSDALSSNASQLGYTWLSTQSLIEESSCQAMIGEFDRARRTALRARAAAQHAQYASLILRALALQAALDTNEGRIERAWDVTVDGLHSFFLEPFPNERGFQFYSELEFAAEQMSEWQLASLLQKEAIAFIHPLRRYDFEATAYFHLAAVEEVIGNVQQARSEIGQSQELFSKLPTGASRDFLEAESRIVLGSLEAKFGSPQLASVQLSGLEQIVKNRGNFTIQLSYEQAEAELQRRLGNETEEIIHLHRCIEIGEEGYKSLTSAPDRWDWEQTTGKAYRRLIEIELSRKHDPLQALAEWETYRAAAIGKQRVLPLQTRIARAREAILDRIKNMGSSSAIVYARFPDSIAAWLLDAKGVQEFRLAGGPKVDHLVKGFYLLCSDPASSQQKVKSSGLRLYEMLLRPIEEQRRLPSTIHIEADGSLATIPWLALTSEDGTYLGARLSVVNTPLGIQDDEGMNDEGRSNLLIAYPGAVSFGKTVYQPLKDAAEEANGLAARSKEAILLRGQDVNTTNLAAKLPDASIFHFAGHAITREYGGELLVHGSRGGEVFSSREISRLNLTKLNLAVLAACDTGTGWDAAKNPNGLVGAFLTAGTHRVIATLWAVDSHSTSMLLSSFYRTLEPEKKKGAEQAWHQAIGPELAKHPYYWAGFQIFGY